MPSSRAPTELWEHAREKVRVLVRWLRPYVHNFYSVAGLLLTVGLLVSLLALWALIGLTEEVMEGDTDRFDRAVLTWLNGHATPWLDEAALEITALGDVVVVVVLVTVTASILWLVGRRTYAALLTVSVAGSAVMTTVLKAIFDRPRPQVFEWRAHYSVTSASYPSGHAMVSMVSFLVVAYIVHRLAKRSLVGLWASALAAVAIVLVGLSRLYLGVHYPSDVLAGYAVGFVWAVFCALVVEALEKPVHGPLARHSSPPRGSGSGVE